MLAKARVGACAGRAQGRSEPGGRCARPQAMRWMASSDSLGHAWALADRRMPWPPKLPYGPPARAEGKVFDEVWLTKRGHKKRAEEGSWYDAIPATALATE